MPYAPLRADLRERFRAAAARRFNADQAEVELSDGTFRVEGAQPLSYADLAADVDFDAPVDIDAAPAAPDTHRFVGEPVPRADLAPKLTGAGFIHDIDLPDMLHARVILPPRPACRLVTCDKAAIAALDGVRDVIWDGSFLAVTSEREEWAIRAADKAEGLIKWEGSALPPFGSVPELLARYDASPDPVASNGSCGTKGSTTLCFTRPFIAHASVGLVCALARFEGDTLTIWSQSQGVFPLRDAIARTLRMPTENVRVIHAPGAGCYGHNGADDVALEAALIAKAVNRPVRLLWTRAQEVQASPAGPAMQVELSAGLEIGRITHWSHQIKGFTHLTRPGWGEGVNLASAWGLDDPQEPSPTADPGQVPFAGAGCRNGPPLYDVPADVGYALIRERPFRTSALRALGAHLNAFAIESMMDELAAVAGRDPLDFRLDHLSDPRAEAVLSRVAEMSDWPPELSDGSTGKGLGFARYKDSAAYCAVVVELELDETVRVARAWAAVDAGQVINPDGLRNQIEGGILQSISWTLKEELRWTENGFDAPDWDAYPVLTFAEVPELSIDVLGRQDQHPLGVGECATGPTSAALANAVKHALGVRIVDMPLTLDRIAQALA